MTANCHPGGGLVGFEPRRQRILHLTPRIQAALCHMLPDNITRRRVDAHQPEQATGTSLPFVINKTKQIKINIIKPVRINKLCMILC
jgi:hypothetical protein